MSTDQITNTLANDHHDTEEPQLHEVLGKIATPASNLKGIGRSLADEIRKAMDLDWAAVALIEHDSEQHIKLYPLSPQTPSELQGKNIVPFAGTPVEWVFNNRRAWIEPDLSKKSPFWTNATLLQQGILSIACQPIFSWGDVLGCLIVGSKRRYAYKDGEMSVLKRSTTRLALFIDNYRVVEESRQKAGEQFAELLEEQRKTTEEQFEVLLEENRQRLDEQTFINRLVSILSFGEDLSHSFEIFTTQLRQRIEFDRLSFAVIEGERVLINLAVSPNDTSPKAGEVYLLGDCGTAWVAERQRTHVENDLTLERQFPIDEIHLKNGIRSMIRLPLLSRTGVFATLNLGCQRPHAFGSNEQAFLEMLAIQIAPSGEKIYLSAREKERKELLNAISHEVKTPLTSIVATTKLLSEELNQTDQVPHERLMVNLASSAESMQSRVSQFLDLALMQASDYKLPVETVSIKTVLEESLSQVSYATQSKGQSIVVMMSCDDSPRVRANRQRLAQIYMLLLNNAISISPHESVIHLIIRTDNYQLITEVQDAGISFTPEEQKELLSPYHSMESDRQKHPEYRLSLALAKRLIELHGGNLWLNSQIDTGNCTGFTLPLTS
ncbi:MAG: GAF domain-containing sensor histidine kinase [Chloroflexota bacterium]|nr:GAF domain-containing sensor histidine kinase [Chloroflexota bacterium]